MRGDNGRNFYRAGGLDALRRCGYPHSDATGRDIKYAADEASADDRSDAHTARNVLMAGAAALPFAGMLGQSRMRHADSGASARDYSEFTRSLRPGDIVISGSPDNTAAKAQISAVTGTPKAYHVSVIKDQLGNTYDTHPAFGVGVGRLPGPDEYYHVLRPTNHDPAKTEAFLSALEQRRNFQARLEGALSSRLSEAAKNQGDALHGVAKSQSPVTASRSLAAHMYRMDRLPTAGLKELLVPKAVSQNSVKQLFASRQAGFNAANPDVIADQIMDGLRDAASKGALTSERLSEAARPIVHKALGDCVGGFCSSLPAEALGEPLVNGKHVHETLPSDWLRSDKVKLVSRYEPQVSGKTRAVNRLLRQAPLAIRAGLGLGLAGGVYGLSKYLARRKARPTEEETD